MRASAETILPGLSPSEHPPGCDGRGWVHGTDGDRPFSGHCQGCARDRGLTRIRDFIPPRFRGAVSLAALPEDVSDWVRRGKSAQGLYLTGRVGSGKTHLAYAALAAWCIETATEPHEGGYQERPYPDDWYEGPRPHYAPSVVFVRATTLFDQLRPGGDEDTRRRIEDCQRAGLLVLDDIGAEKPSEWTCEKLYEVIDERYVQARPLIVTSNVPPSKLSEQVGERVMSRLAEMCEVVPVTGQDRRRPL